MINYRKLAVIGFSFALSISMLTGCKNNDKNAVKEASEAFMEAVKENDTDNINRYSDSEVSSGYFVSLFDGDYMEKKLLSSLGNPTLDEETVAEMDEFYDMYGTLMKEYEVTEVTINDDGSATASVTMTTNFPYDIITSDETSQKILDASNAYTEENSEEIEKIMTEEGADAATEKAYNSIILIAMDVYEQAISDSEEITYKIALTLNKNTETGEWYVTAVQSHDSQVAGTGAPATKTDTSVTDSSTSDISIEDLSGTTEGSSASSEASSETSPESSSAASSTDN